MESKNPLTTSGTHKELYEKKGDYFALVMLQSLAGMDASEENVDDGSNEDSDEEIGKKVV